MGFGGGGSAPSPPPAVSSGPSAHQVLPGAKADAAAKAGGGISPQFLAGLVGQQTGTPGSGMEILADIQKSLGQGG